MDAIKNHDGTPLQAPLTFEPAGIGALRSASWTALPDPAREPKRQRVALAVFIVCVLTAIVRSEHHHAELGVFLPLAGALFAAVRIVRPRRERVATWVGADGVAIVRGPRSQLIRFDDLAAVDALLARCVDGSPPATAPTQHASHLARAIGAALIERRRAGICSAP